MHQTYKCLPSALLNLCQSSIQYKFLSKKLYKNIKYSDCTKTFFRIIDCPIALFIIRCADYFVFVFFVFGHDVHDEMYFLFAFIRTVRAFKLWLFSALPSSVVVKGAFTLVCPTTTTTYKRTRF